MDKFFTLYVAFDVLVFHATFRAGRDHQFQIAENTSKCFPQWANHDRIWTRLNDGDEATKDLSTLQYLIRDGGEFFLYWKLSQLGDVKPDEEKNRVLYDKLGNQSPAIAVKGVLEYLYKVRCNLFHGSKMLEKPQMQILEPSIRCLKLWRFFPNWVSARASRFTPMRSWKKSYGMRATGPKKRLLSTSAWRA